jgi:hypothetical protein
VEIVREVVAHEREEARDCEGFVAIAEYLEVYSVAVVEVGEEADGGIDGNHEEDAYDTGEAG